MKKYNKVVITQSNYIPWKGYFDMIVNSDLLILLDDVQYTRRDWRNRNKIKTPSGSTWLTIPVETKGKYGSQRICETKISNNIWTNDHLNLISNSYKNAPKFKEVIDFLSDLYKKAQELAFLSEVNLLFISEICNYLGIKTKIKKSTDYYNLEELSNFEASERLLNLCNKVNCDTYITGPAAKNYMNVEIFKPIQIKWANYNNYRQYDQLYGDFTHEVSIIDMLMMLGKNSPDFFKLDKLFNEK